VPTGRRDGLISNASEAEAEISGPNFDFDSLNASFSNKGLNVTDLVYLSGTLYSYMFSNQIYHIS